mmetsp:Transcript_40010/g.125957  ORF Transcript_40010/g.125957 Transcript_40010/m.125957 type:complete len:328 (-) Transcript_40010:549-1532(-)
MYRLSDGWLPSPPAYFTLRTAPRSPCGRAGAAGAAGRDGRASAGAEKVSPSSAKMAAAASSCDASWTRAAEIPLPRVSGMILERTTVRPRPARMLCSVAWSGAGLGSPEMYRLSDARLPSPPAYFTLRATPPAPSPVGELPPPWSADIRESRGGKTSPSSVAIAEAASSREASWTIAAEMPVPRVSGMTLERTTVKPRPTKTRLSVAWSGGGLGSPVMYRLSDGWLLSPPAYFSLSMVPPPPHCPAHTLAPLAPAGGSGSAAGKGSPFSARIAELASSTEASCTMAADVPAPRVSGIVRERTTVRPRSAKTRCSVTWSGGGLGSPEM